MVNVTPVEEPSDAPVASSLQCDQSSRVRVSPLTALEVITQAARMIAFDILAATSRSLDRRLFAWQRYDRDLVSGTKRTRDVRKQRRSMRNGLTVSLVRAWLSVAVLTTGSLACSNSSAPVFGEGEVRIETDRTIYAPGDTVQLSITNTGTATVDYKLSCMVFLERLAGSTWTETASSAFGPFGLLSCESSREWFDPGMVLTWAAELPDTLTPGNFRVRLGILRNHDTALPLHPDHSVSNTFAVVR